MALAPGINLISLPHLNSLTTNLQLRIMSSTKRLFHDAVYSSQRQSRSLRLRTALKTVNLKISRPHRVVNSSVRDIHTHWFIQKD